jgi:hypothetical protein
VLGKLGARDDLPSAERWLGQAHHSLRHSYLLGFSSTYESAPHYLPWTHAKSSEGCSNLCAVDPLQRPRGVVRDGRRSHSDFSSGWKWLHAILGASIIRCYESADGKPKYLEIAEQGILLSSNFGHHQDPDLLCIRLDDEHAEARNTALPRLRRIPSASQMEARERHR